MPEVRLIDANALKDRIDSAFTTYGECTYVKGIIDAQPTIEAEPVRHGRWVDWSMWGESRYQCSECNWEMKYKTNFCPACGARMDGGADND